jgi:hypothetical protein
VDCTGGEDAVADEEAEDADRAGDHAGEDSGEEAGKWGDEADADNAGEVSRNDKVGDDATAVTGRFFGVACTAPMDDALRKAFAAEYSSSFSPATPSSCRMPVRNSFSASTICSSFVNFGPVSFLSRPLMLEAVADIDDNAGERMLLAEEDDGC